VNPFGWATVTALAARRHDTASCPESIAGIERPRAIASDDRVQMDDASALELGHAAEREPPKSRAAACVRPSTTASSGGPTEALR
jgi:hypothetical protein